MIILNLGNVKSVEEKIETYDKMLNIQNCKCPSCSGTEFIYYGSYERNVLYIDSLRNQRENKVKIKRIKCKDCGMTHAIIPDFLVPYKQHVIEEIIEVLNEKNVEEISDSKIEEVYGVSRQLRRKWEKSLEKYKAKLCTLYQERNFQKVVKKVKEEEKILQKFYNEYKEILLMMRECATYNYVPT